jgi:transcriptional regulator with XRE-family HTH domain
MGGDPSNRVRERREARGFSQILLAERPRLTRPLSEAREVAEIPGA